MKISEEYLKQQQLLHLNPSYGVMSLAYAPIVADVIAYFNCKSISDYGAGKLRLRQGLETAGLNFKTAESDQGIEYYPYDPVFPYYGSPRAADIVCCIDVLEHIEPECLDAVMLDLQSIVSKLGFFTVHTGPADKLLSDGRNAHLTQQPYGWWRQLFDKYFIVQHAESSEGGFWVLLRPLNTE